MKKFLSMMFVVTVVSLVSCGGGKEVSHEDEGEDDQALQTAATETSAGGGTAAPVVSADAATITGLVKFEGAAPKLGNLQMGADPYCQSQHKTPVQDEEVVLGAGGELANVLVYIKEAPNAPAPTTPALLDQKGCQYRPHVSAVQVGQTLQIKNSDTTLHNINAQAEVNSRFNEAQPVPMTTNKKFSKVEMKPFRIKCDVHGWMRSYMAVLPHPYHGVSQTNGTFTIAGLPPGNYTLVAWHEKFGQQEQPITVAANEQKQVNFSFKG